MTESVWLPNTINHKGSFVCSYRIWSPHCVPLHLLAMPGPCCYIEDHLDRIVLTADLIL